MSHYELENVTAALADLQRKNISLYMRFATQILKASGRLPLAGKVAREAAVTKAPPSSVDPSRAAAARALCDLSVGLGDLMDELLEVEAVVTELAVAWNDPLQRDQVTRLVGDRLEMVVGLALAFTSGSLRLRQEQIEYDSHNLEFIIGD